MTENVTETQGLRERNRNRTMEAIAQAFSEISIVNPRFTMQELADAAGISVRTLYRYYPSREDLIAGVYDLINRHMSHAQLTGEGLPRRTTESRVPHSFRVFSENDALMRAVVVNRINLHGEALRRQRFALHHCYHKTNQCGQAFCEASEN